MENNENGARMHLGLQHYSVDMTTGRREPGFRLADEQPKRYAAALVPARDVKVFELMPDEAIRNLYVAA